MFLHNIRRMGKAVYQKQAYIHHAQRDGFSMAICIIRTLILYLLIIVAVRLMGKKQVGELEPTELVLAMIISDLAAVPMQDFGIPLMYGVIPICILSALTMMLSMLMLKSIWFRELLCGRPSVIVEYGVLLEKEMERSRLTVDELMEELRMQGITDLTSVKYAILENSGQVSVILYEQDSPATPKQLGLQVQETGLPKIIISDGRLVKTALQSIRRDEQWVRSQLRKEGIQKISDVFLMVSDEHGRVFCQKKQKGGRT